MSNVYSLRIYNAAGEFCILLQGLPWDDAVAEARMHLPEFDRVEILYAGRPHSTVSTAAIARLRCPCEKPRYLVVHHDEDSGDYTCCQTCGTIERVTV